MRQERSAKQKVLWVVKSTLRWVEFGSGNGRSSKSPVSVVWFGRPLKGVFFVKTQRREAASNVAAAERDLPGDRREAFNNTT